MKTKLSIIALALALGGAGCQSPSQYVAPRITGRVVDADTQQPLPGVQVRRVAEVAKNKEMPKGGEVLDSQPPVISGTEGSFVVESQRSLSFIRRLHWYVATLSFAYPGYEPLNRTYSQCDSTNSLAGEPMVLAGDVPLKPMRSLGLK